MQAPCHFPDLLDTTLEEDGPLSSTERYHRREYTPAERLGYMILAVAEGDREVCRRYRIPRSTLRYWLNEVGGLEPVREFLQARAVHDFLEAERSIYALVKRQADSDKIPKEELYQTLRSLIHARALQPAQPTQAPGVGAVGAAAQAQAHVTLTVQTSEGESSVIDLGPPPEEA